MALYMWAKLRGGGGGNGFSADEYSCAYGAQINFEDLTPNLTYDSHGGEGCRILISTAKEDDILTLTGARARLLRSVPGEVVVEDSAHPALSRESIGTRFPAISRTASVFQTLNILCSFFTVGTNLEIILKA